MQKFGILCHINFDVNCNVCSRMSINVNNIIRNIYHNTNLLDVRVCTIILLLQSPAHVTSVRINDINLCFLVIY